MFFVIVIMFFFVLFLGIPDKYFFLLWFLHESAHHAVATDLQHARRLFFYDGLPVFVLFLGFKR